VDIQNSTSFDLAPREAFGGILIKDASVMVPDPGVNL
jgi:hypothetical protein